MFSGLKGFVSRHRRKFLVGGIIIGGTILISKCVQRILKEFQEKEMKELFERTQKLNHYESIERTCNEMALSLAPNLKNVIIADLKTEELIEALKHGVSDKVAVWEELKVLSFVKVSALVYSTSILMVTLRIQLNVIGGYMYLDVKDNSHLPQISSDFQQKYLNLCQYFADHGTVVLCNLIKEKVKLIVGNRSLKAMLTIRDIEQIFWAIQTAISSDSRDPCKTLPTYLIPESLRPEFGNQDSNIFNKMLIETQDLLESEEIASLIGSCVSRGFTFVMDQMTEYFRPKFDDGRARDSKPQISDITTASQPAVLPSMGEVTSIIHLDKISKPMAKIIPLVNALVPGHSTKSDLMHLWMLQLIMMDSLKVMGANVYETFSSKI